MQIVPEYHFNGFKRQKGQKVVAEYVVVDHSKLQEANLKHFPDISELTFVQANESMMDDYREVMRICKTHIAHPEVFELCRRIDHLIKQILQDRFTHFGSDRWLVEDKVLPLKVKDNTDD